MTLRTLALGFVLLSAFAPAAEAKLVDRVVAVVNDDVILDSELEMFTAPNLRNPVDLDTPEGEKLFDAMKKKWLDRLIESRLISQQASELKLTVSPEEVERAVDEVKHQNNIDDAAFAEALKQQGFSLEAYKKNLKKQILELKVINTAVRSRIQISDEEIKTAYHQSDRQYAGERLAHLREIVLLIAKDASNEEVDKKRRLAARIMGEAQGGRGFQDLAKSYSEAASKAEGGDLGFVQTGSLVDTLADVVRTMDPGDVRGPIRTSQGFSVLELVEWKSGNLKPYDEVKEQLRRQLYDAQVEKATAAWVKELRKKAHIDVR